MNECYSVQFQTSWNTYKMLLNPLLAEAFFSRGLLYTRQMESSGNYKDIFEKLWVCGVDLWRVYKDMNIIIKGFMHLKKNFSMDV
jgi:hypothetical protein